MNVPLGRNVSVVAAGALAFGMSVGCADPPAGTDPGARAAADAGGSSISIDSTAIVAFWAELDEVWADRDADRFVELFTDDAHFAFVDRGDRLATRDEIHRRFVEQFRSQRPELRHVTEVRRVHGVAPRVAAVDAVVRIVEGDADDASRAVLRRLAIAVVMVRGGDDWRIRNLWAYTLPSEGPGAEASLDPFDPPRPMSKVVQ